MSPPSSSGPSRPEDGIHETLAEVRREISCRVCQGDIKRCRLAICPYLDRVRSWFVERRDLRTTNLFGASPPSAFVGSWGYPKVLVGPLVPPVRDEDTSILDASESWLDYDLAEILRFRRRLVPTEWSITAVDDILAKGLIDEVRGNPWTSEFEVTGASGLANNVVVLLFPGAFMFEGLEAWNLEASPTPAHDHEFAGGRTAYPEQIAGAYHATRLPVLEHLAGRRRQAGAIVFMEVYEDWVPLGVWRYRELARAALAKKPSRFPDLDGAEADLRHRLRLPLENWWRASVLRGYLRGQRRITSYA